MAGLKKAAAAAALGLWALGTPAPAAARVTVTVEVAYGSVVVGGVGVFLLIGGSWDIPFATLLRRDTLLDITPGRVRLGLPLPALDRGGDGSDTPVRVDLVRWRF